MARNIKVVDVYSQEAEQQPNEPDIETVDDDDDEEEDTSEETPELNNEVINEEEPPKSRKKQVLDMPTTDKVVQQVQFLACGKSMSAKNLRYSHAKYCTERNQEPQPVEIPGSSR